MSHQGENGGNLRRVSVVSKLTDCDGELNETDSSLDFARDCGFISIDMHARLTSLASEVGRMLGSMIKKRQAFLITK